MAEEALGSCEEYIPVLVRHRRLAADFGLHKPTEVEGYMGSDYASNPDNWKSTSSSTEVAPYRGGQNCNIA